MTSLERRALMQRLASDARVIVRRFGLRGWRLEEATEARCMRCRSRGIGRERAFGLLTTGACFGCTSGTDDRSAGLVVRVRLYNQRNGRALSYANLIDTLCHEMGHVATWFDCCTDADAHTPEWERAYQRLLAFARVEEMFDPSTVTEL